MSNQLEELLEITKENAMQFALILSSGVPHLQAMGYVCPELEGQALKVELGRWLRSRVVQNAIITVQKKSWQDMELGERIDFAVNKNYTEMAYYLYANNYSDLHGADRVKADTCRTALEAKVAGMAGKMDALSRFWDDVRQGKVALPMTTVKGN